MSAVEKSKFAAATGAAGGGVGVLAGSSNENPGDGVSNENPAGGVTGATEPLSVENGDLGGEGGGGGAAGGGAGVGLK